MWHYYLMSGLYIFAGIMHFVKPKIYLRIMPKYFSKPLRLIHLSGVIEIALGLGLLLPSLKNISIYGIAVMLIVFLPVHIYMIQEEPSKIGAPRWFSVIRLPLQFILIWWAIYYL